MEDLNALSADCIVICCCCQCLILQILVLAMSKLVAKTKAILKKKCRARSDVEAQIRQDDEDGFLEYQSGVEMQRLYCKILHNGRVLDSLIEADMMWEELHEQGVFAFGSFWRSLDECINKNRDLSFDVF